MANDLEWRKRITFLEQQLLRQRDKAQEMVSEKEQELNTLREALQTAKYNRKTSHSSTGSRKEVSISLFFFFVTVIFLYVYSSRNI